MPDDIYHFDPAYSPVPIFEDLYFTWRQALFALVIGKVPHFDLHLAEDICQQVWTEIWQGVTKGTYAYVTPGLLVYRADSRIKDHHRRATRFRQFDPAQHDQSTIVDFDQRIDLQRSIDDIPAAEARVFRLYCLGLTQEEIAEVQMISTRTVRRKLNLATAHLRERLGADPVENQESLHRYQEHQ
jgi:RNA polymerase sigma factor (sigma-70 family)